MRENFGLALRRLITGGIVFVTLIGAFSCENSDQLGFELTPPGERFAYFIDSSSTVSMQTLRQDSLSAERRDPTMLGSAFDEVFGFQQASIATQLRLSSSNVDFGEGIQLDSAILLLKYDGYYGDTTSLQNLKIYELTKDLFYDSTYYSNLNISEYYDANLPIGEKAFYPTPTGDSLTIRLNEGLGMKILEADTSHLSGPAAFLEFFKGIYMVTDPLTSGGALSYFDLAGGKSRLTLYYSNTEDDSLSYEVLINDNCSWVNLFNHDYSGSEVEPYINDSLTTHPLTFLQGASGLRTGMYIELGDSLMSKAEDGIAINKAELLLPVDLSYVNDIRTKPLSLALYGAKEDGTNEFIEDIFLGESYYDGGYHEDKKAYVFNIARYVQNLVHPDEASRIENKGLFLVIGDGRTAANGLVLKNGQDGARLRITYTIVK